MSDDFEIEDGGGRPPSREQVIQVHQYLMNSGRKAGIRAVHAEMEARNFVISLSSVQRWMKDAAIDKHGSDPKRAVVVERRPTNRQRFDDGRQHNGAGQSAAQAPPFTKEDVTIEETMNIRTMVKLIAAEKTSTELAIEENRARMALAIIIADIMAAKPQLLLLDMKGTAALLQALTESTKLSGGVSLDIRFPTDDEKRAAETMKDITPAPKSSFATSLEKFRESRKHSNGNGSGA